MRNFNRSVKVSTLALGVVTALVCGQAMASGFQIREDSVQAMSRSQAGSASEDGDAAVVANNPAAMSMFDKVTVQTDVTAIDLSGTFTGGGHDAAGQPLTGGNGGNAGDTTPVPAFHFIMPVGGGFTFGAAFTAPFGLKTEYDPGWVGRYQALESEVKTMDLTLSGAFKFNDMFSIGASVIGQRADDTLSNAIDFGAILAQGGAPVLPQSEDGTVKVHATNNSVGWDVGLLFRPGSNTNIGLNFRSRIGQNLTGNAVFNVPSVVQAILAANPQTANLGLFTNTAANANVATPSVATFSITQKLNDSFALSANVERTNWSELQNLTVKFANPYQAPSTEVFNWSNSMEYALGMDWKFAPTWVLRAGIARDETPTNNATRDPRLPDNNRLLLSFGLGWTPNANASWNLGYSRINIDTPTVNDATVTGSTLAGKFSADANLFGISGQFSF
jgi:long-chain fatty acid transport protein